jgi:hypothetical protein
MRDGYKAEGVTPYLVGFENAEQNGTGYWFNFLLSNGDRSQQRDASMIYYDHMFPAGCHNKIRSVFIYSSVIAQGFSFYDKEGELLWSIGEIEGRMESVLIEENEVIVGVVCKLWSPY